jgi:hypothetical protein
MTLHREPEPPGASATGTAEADDVPREPGAATARRRFWRLAQLALVVAVCFGVYRALAPELAGLSWSQLRGYRPAPVALAASTALLLCVYFAHALLWRRIMTDLGLARPTARDTVRVYFLASLGRYIPGKLWQLAGLAVLAGRAGIAPAGAAAAAVLGQIAFLTTGLLFLALLLPRWAQGAPAIIAAAILAAAAATLAVIASPWGRGLRARFIRLVPPRFGARLEAALALASRIQPRTVLVWGVAYGLTWIALGLAFSLFVSAFVPEALRAHRHLAGTIAASYLWGYIVVLAPGGLGVREVAMSLLLAQVPGFPVAASLVVAAWSRVWFTFAEVAPLGLVPLLGRGPSREPSRSEAP